MSDTVTQKRSLGQRVKGAILATAKTIKKAVRALKEGANRSVFVVKLTVFRVFIKARPMVRRTADRVSGAWHRAFRPFLKIRAVLWGSVAFILGMVAAPVTTLMVTTVIVSLAIGLIYSLNYLSTSVHPIHRTLLKYMIGMIKFCKGLLYLTTAALSLAAMLMAIPTAVAWMAELILRYTGTDGVQAILVGGIIGSAIMGSWWIMAFEMAALLVARASARRAARDQHWRAKGAAERARVGQRIKLPPCEACGLPSDGPRMSIGSHRGLCTDCFLLLEREQAVEAAKRGVVTQRDLEVAIDAGVAPHADVIDAVRLQPRKQLVMLDHDKRANLSAVLNSQDDLGRAYWAEVGWWYDGDGKRSPRRWEVYVGGRCVAAIKYVYEATKRGYYGEIRTSGTRRIDVKFRTLVGAKDAVAKELRGEGKMIGGMLERLRDEEVPAQAVEEGAEDSATVIPVIGA